MVTFSSVSVVVGKPNEDNLYEHRESPFFFKIFCCITA
jgi:hypothetical protein